ncbi:MAG: HAD family hydrolase [Naasia sp.]
MPHPSVILFDLDDTLFAHRASVEAAAAVTLQSIAPDLDHDTVRAEVTRWNELEEHHYHRYLSGELDYLGQRRARARDFVAPYDVDLADDSAAEQWFEQYLHGYRDAWILHDDALPALDALGTEWPGVRFGIITNGDLDFQLDKIGFLEIGDRFDHIVASGDFGITKPDARIFEHAVGLFGVGVGDCVYVGDRLRTDPIGAARAGLTGVWIDRSGDGVPDADAAEVEELGIIRITDLGILTGALRDADDRGVPASVDAE